MTRRQYQIREEQADEIEVSVALLLHRCIRVFPPKAHFPKELFYGYHLIGADTYRATLFNLGGNALDCDFPGETIPSIYKQVGYKGRVSPEEMLQLMRPAHRRRTQ